MELYISGHDFGYELENIARMFVREVTVEKAPMPTDAAGDRAIQALIAPIMETPMRPAMIGRVPVPSTMRIELWEGEAGAPDFIGPLSPDAAKSAAQGGSPGAVR